MKPSISPCWASIPTSSDPAPAPASMSPPSRASYASHLHSDGMLWHLSECEMKLLDGGHGSVSFSYLVQLGVRSVHLYFLIGRGKNQSGMGKFDTHGQYRHPHRHTGFCLTVAARGCQRVNAHLAFAGFRPALGPSISSMITSESLSDTAVVTV
jgi:hypothetical protein